MEATSRGITEIPLPKKWKDKETNPEETNVWIQQNLKLKTKIERKVPVIYYLSSNGHLEHPHFMEVLLTSNEGLYLTDVINRLNLLRGKGIASKYSWSSKRSYKNGFVWNDLSENDLIHPAHGQEYVLKGSELFKDPLDITSRETEPSFSEKQRETHISGDNCEFSGVFRRTDKPWSSIDLQEYKAETTGEVTEKPVEASTQTEEKMQRRRTIIEEDETEKKSSLIEEEAFKNQSTELSREEISPPPSSSSPETLESLIKADYRIINASRGINESDIRYQTLHNNNHSGRMKASAVLMQLISCGSIPTKDCSSISAKDQGFSLVSHYKSRLPRRGPDPIVKEVECLTENPSFSEIQLEDKEYFSGCLIETRNDDFPALKRSSKFDADERESEGGKGKGKGKCIPTRRQKTQMRKKDGNCEISRTNLHGSKRFNDEQSVD